MNNVVCVCVCDLFSHFTPYISLRVCLLCDFSISSILSSNVAYDRLLLKKYDDIDDDGDDDDDDDADNSLH